MAPYPRSSPGTNLQPSASPDDAAFSGERPMSAAVPAIRIASVVKRYGRTLALDGVSFDVAPNQIFALLGANGAGKTTLMHILSTILAPDSGVAEIAGFDVVREPLEA